MAFKMKGSPAKMGTINGTAGHSSALKMKMEKDAAAKLKKESAMKIKEEDPYLKESAAKMKKESAMKLKEKSPAKHMRSASQKLKHGGGVSQMEFDSVERHNKAHKSGQFDSDHRRPKGKGKYVTKSDDMDKTTNQLTVENLRKKEAREKAKKEVDKKVKDITSIGKNLASGAKMKKKSAAKLLTPDGGKLIKKSRYVGSKRKMKPLTGKLTKKTKKVGPGPAKMKKEKK